MNYFESLKNTLKPVSLKKYQFLNSILHVYVTQESIKFFFHLSFKVEGRRNQSMKIGNYFKTSQSILLKFLAVSSQIKLFIDSKL